MYTCGGAVGENKEEGRKGRRECFVSDPLEVVTVTRRSNEGFLFSFLI